MKKIAQNFKGHYKEMVLGPLFKLLEAVLELFVPLVMARIIDIGIKNNDTAYILRGGLLLAALAALGIVAAVICQYFAALVAGHFGRNLRGQLYAHIMTLSSRETARFGAGGLITRLTGDVNQMQTGVNMAIRLAVRVPFLAVGSIVMAMVINWRVGLVFLASTPLIVLVLYLIMKRTAPRYAAIQAGQDDLSRLAGENLAGTRVIRAFSRQKQEKQEFDEAADRLNALLVRVGKLSAALNPLTGFIVSLAIVGIVWLGAGFAFRGSMLPGEIIALVNYMNQTLLALIVAANLVVLFTRAIASTRRVADVLDTAPSITGGPGAQPVPGAPAVQFSGVRFAYYEGAAGALEDISFAAQEGETIGIIGGTGSGKSTLANLLMRYYDADGGSIAVFGADIRTYALSPLRQAIGLVPQTAALFTGSVRQNLQLDGEERPDDALWRALETAQAANFVRALPDGLDTMIAEGGKNLSGGQKQRLTIARALVAEPEVLVLDDSASALDYATDAALRAALQQDARTRAGRRRTTLLISQRAASIRHAHRILVLDEGRLVGSGTHDELLQTSGVYHEICASQGLAPAEGQVG